MNDFIGNHTPTPEFRASLEREIVSTFRRETQFAPPMRSARGARFRTALALATGLLIGVATAFASTQVADARQREEIASTMGAQRELAAVQLGLARANYEQVQRAFEKGAIPQASRLSAEAELHASEAKVARIELDLAESGKTAAPPRDELWAPLVGGRDFVKERLSIQAAAAERRLASVAAAAADADRAFSAGVLTRPAVAETQSELLQARREVDAVARKLSLRKEFLDEHLAPEDVARRLQQFELMTDVERAEQLLRLAQERLAIARERSGLGAAGEVKVKKAQVAVLEHSLELDQLRLNSARTALTFRAPAQQGIPLVDLSAASARTTEPLGALLGIRELPGGRLLVNDAGNRQLRLFEPTLATSSVVLDSTPGIVNRYGARVPLVRYFGDSSLLPDIMSRTIRVLDGRGQVARTVALPNAPVDLSGPSYIDDKGRVLYIGMPDSAMWRLRSDSTSILRIDLVSRRVDTVGRVKTTRNGLGVAMNWVDPVKPGVGAPQFRGDSLFLFLTRGQSTDALVPTRDDWAVLSDGSIAFVRGHDYHIDWIRPNGSLSASPPLAMDWKRLAEDDKQQVVDSGRAMPTITGGGRGRSGGGGGRAAADDSVQMGARAKLRLFELQVRLLDVVAGLQSPSFGAAIPDLDGNLWILPTAPAQRQNVQLVYDVVDAKGHLFERVRMPVGRSVAGFGKGGVVYLVSGDRRDGLSLERTKLGTRH